MHTVAWLERSVYSSASGVLNATPLASHRTDVYLAENRIDGTLIPVRPSLSITRTEMMHVWNVSHALDVELRIDLAGVLLHWRARASPRTKHFLSPDVLASLDHLFNSVQLDVVEFPSRFVASGDAQQVADTLVDALRGNVRQSRCLPIGSGYLYDTQLRMVTTQERPSVVFPPMGVVWEAPVDERRRAVLHRVVRAAPPPDEPLYPTLLLTDTVRYWRGTCDVTIEHPKDMGRIAPPVASDAFVCVHHRLLDVLPKGQVWGLVVFDDAELYMHKVSENVRALRRLLVSDAYALMPSFSVDFFVTERSTLTNCDRFNVRACTMRMSCIAREPIEVIACSQTDETFVLPIGFHLKYVPECFAMHVLSRIHGPKQFTHDATRAFANGPTECLICYERGDTITECGHVLCVRCARRLFSRDPHCPSCRRRVTNAFTTNHSYNARGAAILDAVQGGDTLVLCDEMRHALYDALKQFFRHRHARHITLVKTFQMLPPRRSPPCIVFAHVPATDATADILYRRARALSKRVFVVSETTPATTSS
jgi:hypothetical protein